MKKLALLTIGALALTACNNTTNNAEGKDKVSVAEVEEQQTEYAYYGDTISDEGAVAAEELMNMLEEEDSIPVKVAGTVNSSCKMKGCWMKVDLGNDKEMHVSFKDYGFFVPKNLDGEKAIMQGYASVDTLDVAYLRHLAQDAGKSQEEIDKITEPEVSLTYVATGVLIEE